MPGVILNRSKTASKNSETTKRVKVVQKSKSDSAISNTRSNEVFIANKQAIIHPKESNQTTNVTGYHIGNTSQISGNSFASRRASLKNLNVEDKKRVANLIKELAKTGEERELALERLQEERVSFEEQLNAVQAEQNKLKEEREALKNRLEHSEKLSKKYQKELRDFKSRKEKEDAEKPRTIKALPRTTQTSPSLHTFNKESFNSLEMGDHQPSEQNKLHGNEANSNKTDQNITVTATRGRRQWGLPPVPIYSNSLFDMKVSNVEQKHGEDEQRFSSVDSSGSFHELYLKECALQLRLQEQQIEIQRQQMQLQQQLQVLQQQQQVVAQEERRSTKVDGATIREKQSELCEVQPNEMAKRKLQAHTLHEDAILHREKHMAQAHESPTIHDGAFFHQQQEQRDVMQQQLKRSQDEVKRSSQWKRQNQSSTGQSSPPVSKHVDEGHQQRSKQQSSVREYSLHKPQSPLERNESIFQPSSPTQQTNVSPHERSYRGNQNGLAIHASPKYVYHSSVDQDRNTVSSPKHGKLAFFIDNSVKNRSVHAYGYTTHNESHREEDGKLVEHRYKKFSGSRTGGSNDPYFAKSDVRKRAFDSKQRVRGVRHVDFNNNNLYSDSDVYDDEVGPDEYNNLLRGIMHSENSPADKGVYSDINAEMNVAYGFEPRLGNEDEERVTSKSRRPVLNREDVRRNGPIQGHGDTLEHRESISRGFGYSPGGRPVQRELHGNARDIQLHQQEQKNHGFLVEYRSFRKSPPQAPNLEEHQARRMPIERSFRSSEKTYNDHGRISDYSAHALPHEEARYRMGSPRDPHPRGLAHDHENSLPRDSDNVLVKGSFGTLKQMNVLK
ncbi:bromodomain-containing protein DDB_G0280777-like [Xenia sp. Carnegie-2017]|uniref:bromodomain-containing protein DDB_G0280777-like n=1 Tax=Xenia sp. Carnegie-2017 TaxID=2897299 RepID=UPI001F04C620|nr:bromodomain-containing protein DDB_G0280777-like [Xenia sp. Carnegie-2017]